VLVFLAVYFIIVLADTVADLLHVNNTALNYYACRIAYIRCRPNTLDMAFKGANQRETRGAGLVRWIALPIHPLDMTTFDMIAGAAPIGYLIAGDVANGKSSM
jgi:hypothetical protein